MIAKLFENFEEGVDMEIISLEDFTGRKRGELNLKVIGQKMKKHLNFVYRVKALILSDFDYFDI